MLKDRITLDTESYFHYLHHKYVKVNYGSPLLPVDKWFDTFHDGSEDALLAMMTRARNRRADPAAGGGLGKAWRG